MKFTFILAALLFVSPAWAIPFPSVHETELLKPFFSLLEEATEEEAPGVMHLSEAFWFFGSLKEECHLRRSDLAARDAKRFLAPYLDLVRTYESKFEDRDPLFERRTNFALAMVELKQVLGGGRYFVCLRERKGFQDFYLMGKENRSRGKKYRLHIRLPNL